MRVPLVIQEKGIFLNVSIRCKSLRLFGIVQFLIDTGSPHTFLSKTDVQRLNISQSAFSFDSDFSMAGSKYRLLVNPNALNINMKEESGKLVTLVKRECTIALPTTPTEAYSIPSIIGRDFLIENELALYFAPKKGIAFLEK